MSVFPEDIFTKPAQVDVHTLRNLGPLRALAGIWTGARGMDTHVKAQGEVSQAYVDRIELQPLDPATNGPQLLYGLRYHQFVTRPGEASTYHDQVGYFLWEPATGTVMQTLAIPRGQIAMAVGKAKADAREFELVAKAGDANFGICSNPFLDYAHRTQEYRIKIRVNADGTWTYDEDTVLLVGGRAEPFHHRDVSTLTKIAEPTPNPLARIAAGAM